MVVELLEKRLKMLRMIYSKWNRLFLIVACFFMIGTILSSGSSRVPVELFLNGDNAILLKNAQFDTKATKLTISASGISQYPSDMEGYYIVQFTSYIHEDWKMAVRDTGAVIFDYVPNNAFIVRMNASVKSKVEALQTVQWVGIYEPAYRINPVLQASGSVRENITVLLFDSTDNERISGEIKKLGGIVVESAGDRIQVRIDRSKISDVAVINGVYWIEKYVPPVIFNDVAANITGVYSVRNTHGLNGSGQIVAVADSGLDTGVDNHGVNGDIHLDFDNRVTFFNYWGSSPDDRNGHGTHTTGSVAGNGSRSNGQYKGIAPEAQIISQGLGEDAGSNSIYITDLTGIFQDAYDNGARIHSNSWGGNYESAYTSQSEETDQFIWNNKDMLIFVAAGNDGDLGEYNISRLSEK